MENTTFWRQDPTRDSYLVEGEAREQVMFESWVEASERAFRYEGYSFLFY